MELGMVGLGRMGGNMAERLRDKGLEVVGFDAFSDATEVPGEPYTFGALIRAQADGDLQTLRAHGLDAVRVGKEVL